MGAEPRTYFLANACHVCKSKSASCPCEICRMIFYCSPDHRRSNWFDHSQICWAINKICESGRCKCLWELHDGKDLIKFKHGVAGKCTELLKRSLKPWELEMIYHPRMCGVCGEFNWKHLSFCEGCEFVYTCQKRHFRKDHVKWCKTMKVYSELIIHQSLGGEDGAIFCDFQIKNNDLESLDDVLSQSCHREDEHETSEIQKALRSEVLTYPLTVLHALRSINALGKPDLEILFIGAENQAEMEPLSKWERYLLHCLGNVETLKLTFLGPELRVTTGKSLGTLCESCRKRGRNLKLEFISGKFYHECPPGRAKQPDLICAFNSGMYRDFGFGNENSWKGTIQKLFASGSPPVLITEYTCRELKMVLERIRDSCGDVSVIVQPGVNPFASLKPGLNIISKEEAPVIFKNYYHVLLQKDGYCRT